MLRAGDLPCLGFRGEGGEEKLFWVGSGEGLGAEIRCCRCSQFEHGRHRAAVRILDRLGFRRPGGGAQLIW